MPGRKDLFKRDIWWFPDQTRKGGYRLVLFFLICIPYLFPAQTFAQDYFDEEKILFYSSEIDIDSTGLVHVSETIRVRAQSNNIKRGIYRTIPTIYKGRFLQTVTTPLEVTEILRDGSPEEYFLEEANNGVRIYIGRKDHELPPGDYTYTIGYTIERQIGFFEDYDEFYWNVTGLDWDFTIDSVYAVVNLPAGGSILRDGISAYSGASGETGCDCMISPLSEVSAAFHTTVPLYAFEGLTVAVPFRKGLISPPSRDDLTDRFLADNYPGVVALVGLAVVLLYYFGAWLLVGKDPRGRTIIARFEPPGDLTPYELRYLKMMRFDNKAMVACLVWMAQRGHLTIEETDRKKYTLTRVKNATQTLNDVEKEVLAALFSKTSSITLSNSYNPAFGTALASLKAHLRHKLMNFAFRLNRRWTVVGILLSVAVMIVSCIQHPFDQAMVGLFMVVWLSGWTVACLFLIKGFVTTIRERKYAMTFALLLFVVPFLGAEIFALGLLVDIFNFYTYVTFVLLWVINITFFSLLKAPTLAGRQLLDEIESFSLFLRTAEMPRIQSLSTTPAMDLNLFEQYLPYALALDLQTAWASHFEDQLSAPDQVRQPHWYKGVSSFRSLGEFSSSFGQSLSSSISSSSTPPGSRSGSSGGGSSGGGGGGGGGGGW